MVKLVNGFLEFFKPKTPKEDCDPRKKLIEEGLTEQEASIIDWTTFYRRNIHRFIEHYLEIRLHFYQKIMVYLMHKSPMVVLLCARAIAKSFITAVYACAVCILYPGSMVVATAMTKKQASLLVSEKIKKELMKKSPILAKEIKTIKTSENNTEVMFHNGSSFITCVAGETARGLRNTVLIIDEFRLVDKQVIDTILSPQAIVRQAPYLMLSEYSALMEELQEDPREIYLSSAFWKSHWMWRHIKQTVVDMYAGEAILFATDYALTIKHGIRTRKQMIKEKKKLGSFGFDMEYNNLMMGGAEQGFFTYELVSKGQTLIKPWYPRTREECVLHRGKLKPRPWDIPRIEGEIRVVSADIAMLDSTSTNKNDNSIFKCIRALPSGDVYDRHCVYSETIREGKDTFSQAVRLRQLMEDFEADYLVLDGRNAGVSVLDILGRVMYDEERDVEYEPIKCYNNDLYAQRCKNPNAPEIIYLMTATDEINNDMHYQMFSLLESGRYKTLISSITCKEQFLFDREEYDNCDVDGKIRMEMPYLESDLELQEMVNLTKSFVKNGKYMALSEPSTGTKDRYIASGYANYFITRELEQDLYEDEENEYSDQQLFVSEINWEL